MISAQTPLAFVARENRLPLFRIMLAHAMMRGRRGALLASSRYQSEPAS
jgi:hypothetical protein